jgi:TadE-like protein
MGRGAVPAPAAPTVGAIMQRPRFWCVPAAGDPGLGPGSVVGCARRTRLAGAGRRGWRGARHRAQSVVEFGLVMLVLFLLFSVMYDFGMLLNVRESVSALSRDLARQASVGATRTELLDAARRAPLIGVNSDGFAGYCCDPGDAVVVNIAYYSGGCTANCQPITSGIKAGDRVVVQVAVAGAEAVTPLARPIVGCTDGTVKHCYVPQSAQTTMRLEGTPPPG